MIITEFVFISNANGSYDIICPYAYQHHGHRPHPIAHPNTPGKKPSQSLFKMADGKHQQQVNGFEINVRSRPDNVNSLKSGSLSTAQIILSRQGQGRRRDSSIERSLRFAGTKGKIKKNCVTTLSAKPSLGSIP